LKLPAARLDVLIWTLIYGGLFGVVLGLALARNGAGYGTAVVVAGALAIAIGVVLVWTRSLVRDP